MDVSGKPTQRYSRGTVMGVRGSMVEVGRSVLSTSAKGPGVPSQRGHIASTVPRSAASNSQRREYLP